MYSDSKQAIICFFKIRKRFQKIERCFLPKGNSQFFSYFNAIDLDILRLRWADDFQFLYQVLPADFKPQHHFRWQFIPKFHILLYVLLLLRFKGTVSHGWAEWHGERGGLTHASFIHTPICWAALSAHHLSGRLWVMPQRKRRQKSYTSS